MDGPKLASFPGMFAFLCGSTFNLYLGGRHTSKCADQMLTFWGLEIGNTCVASNPMRHLPGYGDIYFV